MAGRQLYTSTQGRVKVWPLATHGRPEAAQFRGRKKATGGVNSFEGSGGNSGDQGGTTGGGETSRFLPLLDAFSCRSKRKDGEALLHLSTAPHSLSFDYLALTSSLNAINHGFSYFLHLQKTNTNLPSSKKMANWRFAFLASACFVRPLYFEWSLHAGQPIQSRASLPQRWRAFLVTLSSSPSSSISHSQVSPSHILRLL